MTVRASYLIYENYLCSSKYSSIHEEIKVQVCTPTCHNAAPFTLGSNLAPQKQVCTPKGAISVSLHLL